MAQNVTSTEDVYGFKVGADYKLAEYTQIENYLSKLDDTVSSRGVLKETLYRERFGTRELLDINFHFRSRSMKTLEVTKGF